MLYHVRECTLIYAHNRYLLKHASAIYEMSGQEQYSPTVPMYFNLCDQKIGYNKNWPFEFTFFLFTTSQCEIIGSPREKKGVCLGVRLLIAHMLRYIAPPSPLVISAAALRSVTLRRIEIPSKKKTSFPVENPAFADQRLLESSQP